MRFPALKFYSLIYKLIGYFTIFTGLILALITALDYGIFFAIIPILGGFLLGSIALVASESINVFIRMEDHLFVMRRYMESSNARRSATRSAQKSKKSQSYPSDYEQFQSPRV